MAKPPRWFRESRFRSEVLTVWCLTVVMSVILTLEWNGGGGFWTRRDILFASLLFLAASLIVPLLAYWDWRNTRAAQKAPATPRERVRAARIIGLFFLVGGGAIVCLLGENTIEGTSVSVACLGWIALGLGSAMFASPRSAWVQRALDRLDGRH